MINGTVALRLSTLAVRCSTVDAQNPPAAAAQPPETACRNCAHRYRAWANFASTTVLNTCRLHISHLRDPRTCAASGPRNVGIWRCGCDLHFVHHSPSKPAGPGRREINWSSHFPWAIRKGWDEGRGRWEGQNRELGEEMRNRAAIPYPPGCTLY